MALFRALCEPRRTLKLETAARKLENILTSAPSADKPAEPLALRRGAIREAVIEVLMQADGAIAPLEVRRRAASRVGQPVNRSTIDSCLMKVVADPDAPVVKVGPGRYASTADEVSEPAPLSPQMELIWKRALAVLRTSNDPMRPAEIWSAVEAQHGEATSYEAIASFLSFAAKHPDLPIERVKRGWYQLR